MDSSDSCNNQYISMFFFAKQLSKPVKDEDDLLTVNVEVAEGIIPAEHINHSVLGKVFQPKTSKIDAYTRALLRSAATEQCQTAYPYLDRFLSLVICKTLASFKILPSTSEKIFHWGAHHRHNPSSELKTLVEILDLLKYAVLEAAKMENCHAMDIQIRKLEKVTSQEFQERVPEFKNRDHHKVITELNPLGDWIKENDNDVDYHRYYEWFVLELHKRAPKDNPCFGLRSVEVKKQEGLELLCPICLKDMKQGSQAIMIQLPCCPCHVFHGKCIIDWFLKKKSTCPMCRVNVFSISEIEEIVNSSPVTYQKS